jgi:hypothetical protein
MRLSTAAGKVWDLAQTVSAMTVCLERRAGAVYANEAGLIS